MYHPMLLAGLTALILGSIQAQADERYPAASFEPKVIYRAESAPVQAVEYPAASFTPEVIFQDPNLIQTTGPALESLSASVPSQLRDAPAAKKAQTSRLGAVSDVTPPYTALGLAVAAIALAFWQASRRYGPKVLELDSALAQGGGVGQGAQEGEEGQDLEALALEVEQTLATTNRQRAGKTKRTRRR